MNNSKTIAYRFIFASLIIHSFYWFGQRLTTIPSQFEALLAKVISYVYSMLLEQTFAFNNRVVEVTSSKYLVIDNTCTAILLCLTMIAYVISLDISRWKKLLFIMGSFVIIQLVNIVRIVHLFYIMLHDEHWFYFYHIYVWQALNIGLALLLVYVLRPLKHDQKALQ